jgi:hypothetical protein
MQFKPEISVGDLLTAISVMIALIAYLWDRKKTRDTSDAEAFDSLNSKWIELLEKFTDYPDLILDFGEPKDSISVTEKKKTIYCHMLLSLLEMAYLKYRGTSKKIWQREWKGWDSYIGSLFARGELKNMWQRQLFSQYDDDFVAYINSKISKTENGPARRPP